MRRRAASVVAAVLAAAALAGCGGPDPAVGHTLDAFFAHSARGRSWGRLFPHRPGSRPCTVQDLTHGRPVAATCSTALAFVQPGRAVVTLTETWNGGSRARTWFVFIRRDGEIDSVLHERVAPPPPATTTTATTTG